MEVIAFRSTALSGQKSGDLKAKTAKHVEYAHARTKQVPDAVEKYADGQISFKLTPKDMAHRW